MHKKTISIFIILSVLGISACNSPKTVKVGEGVVNSETKINNPKKDSYISDTTEHGTEIGLGTGAVVGGVVGGGVGFVAGTLCTVVTLGILVVPCYVGGVGGGIIVGGLIGGGSGALIGAGSGYVYASREHAMGLYQYNVVMDGQVSPLQFDEYPSENMPKNTRVIIYDTEYNGHHSYHIEPVDEKLSK